MTVAVAASGTQTATIGTEHLLNAAAFTTAGAYVLTVNMETLVNGEELELRIYEKVLSGDTAYKLVYYANYFNLQGDGSDSGAGTAAQGEVVAKSPPVNIPYGVKFTLLQVSGTGRSFKWRVDTL